jgi:hypothetical protein
MTFCPLLPRDQSTLSRAETYQPPKTKSHKRAEAPRHKKPKRRARARNFQHQKPRREYSQFTQQRIGGQSTPAMPRQSGRSSTTTKLTRRRKRSEERTEL